MRVDRFATLVLCCLVATSGCYFGSNKSAKTGAYVVNGTALGLGTLIALTSKSGSCSGSSCGIGAGSDAIGAFFVSTILIGIGGIGLLRNLLSPTTSDMPAVVAPPAASSTATVATPGLPRTRIELR